MEPIVLSEFGGLRLDVDPAELRADEFPVLENIYLDRNAARVRPGFNITFALDTTHGKHRTLFEYHETATDTRYLLFAAGAYIGFYDEDGVCTWFDTTVHATNPIRFAQFGSRVYVADGNGAVQVLFTDMVNPEDVVVLASVNTPTVAPTVTVLDSTGIYNQTVGSYYVKYTYTINGQESEASPETEFTTLHPLDQEDITITIDAALTDVGQQVYYTLYIRPFNETEYYRWWNPVAFNYAGATTYNFTWIWLGDRTAPVYAVDSTAPPTGVTTLANINGLMMLYAKAGTLYWSNVDEPTQVPSTLASLTADGYGGTFPLAEGARTITAIVPMGMYTLVFADIGVWRVTGDPGALATFSIEQISIDRGCALQELTTGIDEALCFFSETNSGTWQWTAGGGFVPVGLPVRTAWQGASTSTAFQVYSPDAQVLMVVVGQNTTQPSPTPTGWALVYHLRTQRWSTFTVVPQLCACYCRTYRDAPGIYLADSYNPAVSAWSVVNVSITNVDGVVEVTTLYPHRLTSGATVTLAGVTMTGGPDLNGAQTVTSIVSTTKYRFSKTTTGSYTASVKGTSKPTSQMWLYKSFVTSWTYATDFTGIVSETLPITGRVRTKRFQQPDALRDATVERVDLRFGSDNAPDTVSLQLLVDGASSATPATGTVVRDHVSWRPAVHRAQDFAVEVSFSSATLRAELQRMLLALTDKGARR